MATAYERRNQRAKDAGFSSYWHQRQARRLNYNTAAEYREAKGGRRAIPAPAPVAVPAPASPITSGPIGGGLTGYYADGRSTAEAAALIDAIAAAGSRADAMPDGVRGTAGERVHIYVGGARVGGKSGFSASYLRDVLAELDPDDFYDWLDDNASISDPYQGTGGGVSVTIG